MADRAELVDYLKGLRDRIIAGFEEIEPKAVAFDVYLAVGGSEKTLRKVTRRASFILASELLRCFSQILRYEGILYHPAEWIKAYRKLFGKQGIFAGTLPLYMDIYRPGFHPWQQDNQALLEKWIPAPL